MCGNVACEFICQNRRFLVQNIILLQIGSIRPFSGSIWPFSRGLLHSFWKIGLIHWSKFCSPLHFMEMAITSSWKFKIARCLFFWNLDSKGYLFCTKYNHIFKITILPLGQRSTPKYLESSLNPWIWMFLVWGWVRELLHMSSYYVDFLDVIMRWFSYISPFF